MSCAAARSSPLNAMSTSTHAAAMRLDANIICSLELRSCGPWHAEELQKLAR